MTDVLLVHPPVALPTEPPIGIATLAAELRSHGVEVECIDASAEALDRIVAGVDEATARNLAQARALRDRSRILAELRAPATYADPDRYRRAVADLGKILELAGTLAAEPGEVRVSLANYLEGQRTPLSSRDLQQAAAQPETSPFFNYFTDLADRIAAHRPRVIGLSINYLHQGLPALALAGVVRRRLPGIPLLAGGGLLRCWEGRLASTGLAPALDELVFEHGARRILELLGRAPATLTRSPLVLPDHTAMPWSCYLAPTRIIPFITSQGCSWGHCRYCPEALHGPNHLRLTGDQLREGLGQAALVHGGGLVHLADSTIPAPLLQDLAAAPPAHVLPWYGFTRFYRLLTDPAVCRGLRASGCCMLQLGLESGSSRVLRRLRKGINLGQASQAIRALTEAGIAVYLYVMFGIPTETVEDARLTLAFVAEHAPLLHGINTSVLNLPVGSPPEADLELYPLPGDHCDLTLYTAFRSPQGWERRDARRFLEREFSRQPAIAALLHRTPPVFGPNHAPFFGGPTGPRDVATATSDQGSGPDASGRQSAPRSGESNRGQA